jgi:hypothetical protein
MKTRIVSIDGIVPMRKSSCSMWEPLFEQLKGVKPGEAIVVEVADNKRNGMLSHLRNRTEQLRDKREPYVQSARVSPTEVAVYWKFANKSIAAQLSAKSDVEVALKNIGRKK